MGLTYDKGRTNRVNNDKERTNKQKRKRINHKRMIKTKINRDSQTCSRRSQTNVQLYRSIK